MRSIHIKNKNQLIKKNYSNKKIQLIDWIFLFRSVRASHYVLRREQGFTLVP